jgi:lysophospholipase L1-like esterase
MPPRMRPTRAADEIKRRLPEGTKQLNGSKMCGFLLALAAIIIASTSITSAQIVALGHSAVRGHVAESEMWPAVLENMLRAKGSQVRIINAGVNGGRRENCSLASTAPCRPAPGSSFWPSTALTMPIG